MNWKTLLDLGRISNLPTIWTNTVTGVVVTGASVQSSIFLVMVGLSLAYIGGMFLNDAFDRHHDAIARPRRPIPSGRATIQQVFVVGFALLAASLLVLIPLALQGKAAALYSATVLIALIVLYDYRHKNFVVAPFLMGACRMMVYLTAGLSAARMMSSAAVGAAVAICFYTVGLTYLARDNRKFGARIFGLIFLVAPLLYVFSRVNNRWSLTFAMLSVVWIIHSVRLLLLQSKEHAGVAGLIAGMCLFDAVLLTSHGQVLFGFLAVAAFAVTHVLQRVIQGT